MLKNACICLLLKSLTNNSNLRHLKVKTLQTIVVREKICLFMKSAAGARHDIKEVYSCNALRLPLTTVSLINPSGFFY